MHPARGDGGWPGGDLTPRELDIFRAVARRLSNEEIADVYTLSKRTVEGYLSTLYRKLGVSTRRALIAAGQQKFGDGQDRRAPAPLVAAAGSHASAAESSGRVRTDAGKAAFQRAVQAERSAIHTHEEAARRLDQLAADLEQAALMDRDERVRRHAIQVAEDARRRAGYARDRAYVVRRRLRAEGVDSGS